MRWNDCRLLTGLVLLLTLLTALAAPQAAAQDKKGKGKKGKDKDRAGILDVTGRPEGLEPGRPVRYYVWFEKEGWRVRTTTAGKPHQFHGVIRIEGGQLEGVQIPKLDGVGPASDRIVWNHTGTEIRFDFKTKGHIDGVNFRVTGPGARVHFSLLIDGQAHPERVFVGPKGVHPSVNPFTLPGRP
jgi:hypothetical protein